MKLAAALLATILTGLAAPAGAAPGSPLLLPLVSGDETPTLIYAQRAIERSWGASDDSVYIEVDVPQWRHEGLAVGMSAVIPGTGQLYAGDRRGLWYLLAEAALWVTYGFSNKRGDEFREEAALFAGAPQDSASTWSFDRWTTATHQDPAEMQRLYDADPEAFYDRIATDPQFLSGWSGDPIESRDHFSSMRETSDDRLEKAHYALMGLYANHVAAAVAAFRAARLHNLKLGPHFGLKVKSGWRRGPTLTAVIERRF